MTTRTKKAVSSKATKIRPHLEGRRPNAAALDDGDGDDEELQQPGASQSPLGAEPLAADEIATLTAKADDVDEQLESGLEILRKESEMKLPVDPDAGDAHVVATDEELDVRLRPTGRR